MLKLAAFLLAFVGFGVEAQADPIVEPIPVEDVKVVIDPEKSTLHWVGYKVTGKHNGSVNIESGELALTDGSLTAGHFVIDMPSIAVHDLEGDSRDRLENHLKSDDFFGVANHPKATFKFNKATETGNRGTYKVEGQLTIKNITNPIAFEARVFEENGKTVATADIKVDRSKYDIRYRSGSFFQNLGDKAIYDEFDISVRLVGDSIPAN